MQAATEAGAEIQPASFYPIGGGVKMQEIALGIS